MNQYCYLFAFIGLFLEMTTYSMLTPLVKTGLLGKRTTLHQVQKRERHVTRPIDSEFISSITSLEVLEQTLRHDYLSAQKALEDLYVEDPDAFGSFKKAYINHIKTQSLQQSHPDIKRPAALKEVIAYTNACSRFLGANPQALSYTLENISTSNFMMTAKVPSIALIAYTTPEEDIKEENGEPFTVSITGFGKTEKPGLIAFNSAYLNYMLNPENRNHILHATLHELCHVLQYHAVPTNLLLSFNSITYKDSHWGYDPTRNSIDHLASKGIDFEQTPEVKALYIQEERMADLLPLCMLKSLAKEIHTSIDQDATRGHSELYLSQKEFHALSGKIVDCWDKESVDKRPMALLYE